MKNRPVGHTRLKGKSRFEADAAIGDRMVSQHRGHIRIASAGVDGKNLLPMISLPILRLQFPKRWRFKARNINGCGALVCVPADLRTPCCRTNPEPESNCSRKPRMNTAGQDRNQGDW